MSSPHLSDTDLVLAARRREPDAWQALLDRYDRRIRAVCHAHRLGAADAEDVRQTTWLRAVEHVDRIREPHRIGAWLAQVARNECLRAIRHRARVTTYADELEHRISDPAPAPDALMVAAERREAVRGAVKKLSPRDRAFLGRVFGDHEPSYAEIGIALRMPIGSIGPTRGRVLERMRRNAQLATLVATG